MTAQPAPAQRMEVPIGAPPGFVAHRHRYAFELAHPRERVWRWLAAPETFVAAATWPWRVEFVGGGFEPGVRTAHYGPGMNFAGVLTEVSPPAYRDLQYCYGAYALSLRLARPTRLQFWLDELATDRTRVRLQVDALMRPWLGAPASALQWVFWRRFGRWAARSV